MCTYTHVGSTAESVNVEHEVEDRLGDSVLATES